MEVSIKPDSKATSIPITDRKKISQQLKIYEQEFKNSGSQRKAIKEMNIPRGTLRYWKKNETSDFFNKNGEAGLDFLKQIYDALIFSFGIKGNSGIESIREFLELSGLSEYLASSHGSIHKATKEMERIICEFGARENRALGRQMPHKRISCALDESFYKRVPYLVGIEPVSNFIFLEKPAKNRTAEQWREHMTESLKNFNVSFLQCVGDQGKGITKCVKTAFGVHYSDDIFHVQYELTKAMTGSLNGKVRHHEKAVEDAQKKVRAIHKKKEKYEATEIHGPGRPQNFDKKIQEETTNLELIENKKLNCEKNRTLVKETKKSIGEAYHPLNLETGDLHNATSMRKALESKFETIEKVAEEEKLSEVSTSRIQKAKRVLNSLISNITFFWIMVNQLLNSRELREPEKDILKHSLIPLVYIQSCIKKTRNQEFKKSIMNQENQIKKRLEKTKGWWRLSDQKKEQLINIAEECAQMFQRSSSCVEGRNSQMKTHYRNNHRLSEGRITALTVIHNYHIKRSDGTTAAERFFEFKPKNLFEYLKKNTSFPAKPAKSQRRKLKEAA